MEGKRNSLDRIKRKLNWFYFFSLGVIDVLPVVTKLGDPKLPYTNGSPALSGSESSSCNSTETWILDDFEVTERG